MKLTINKSKIVTEDFIKYVILQMQIYGKAYLDANPKRVDKFDEFFKEKFKEYENKISAHDIVFLGLDNLTYSELEDVFVIEINPNKRLPYFDRKYLITYCMLIDKGNLSIKGSHIFGKTFRYALNSLNSLAYMFSIRKKRKRRSL